MADETDYQEDHLEKAVSDCIANIRKFHHKQRLAELKAQLAVTIDPEEKSNIFKALVEEQKRDLSAAPPSASQATDFSPF